jgi:electron transfer flavoprotein beta subunit
MKILVPVKRVVDYNVKVRVKADGSGVDIANVKMSMNPFDEIAVEEAVRLKEAGTATEIIAVSCGITAVPGDAAHRDGHRRRPRHPGRDDDELQPLAVAKLLQGVVGKEARQIVILGKQAIDDDCNQTGQMLRRADGLGAGHLRLEGRRSRAARPPSRARSTAGWRRCS